MDTTQLQSESIQELAAALSKMQGELESAAKTSENPFFKNKYADLSTVWDTCRGPMSRNGLALVQQIQLLGDRTILVTTLTHSTGQWMRSYAPIICAKQDAQGMGAGITYMRRYSMCAMLGITQDDDDGNTASGMSEKPSITEKDVDKKIQEMLDLMLPNDREIASKYLGFCKLHYKSKKGKKWAEVLLNELVTASGDLEKFMESVYSWNSKQAA